MYFLVFVSIPEIKVFFIYFFAPNFATINAFNSAVNNSSGIRECVEAIFF